MDLRGASTRLLAVALASAGCAPAAAPRVGPELLAAGAHVYHRPAAEVRAAVEAELVAEGFVVSPPAEDGLVRTEWKMLIDGREFATFRERYVVLVKRLTARHARVEAVRITMSTLGSDITKTWHMGVPAGISDRYAGPAIYGVGPERPSVPRGVARDLAFERRVYARIEPERARVR